MLSNKMSGSTPGFTSQGRGLERWSRPRGATRQKSAVVVAFFWVVLGFVSSAGAFPGFIAGKGAAARHNHSTQVVLMKKGDTTAVTIWADYEGPLDKFALVLPVPGDVKLSNVRTLQRDAVDHLDEITAPRFHEYWEMDACAAGEPSQEWERDLSVKGGADTFLGSGMPDLSGTRKLAEELRLDVESHFKKGEYKFSLVPKGKAVDSYLKRKGLVAPPGVAKSVEQYTDQGMRILVAEVQADKVELTGSRRALLSPIRFSTRQAYSLPSTLGQANSPGFQELILYVMHPADRFEVAEFPTAFPPTNITVDEKVKERLGDFYASLHDALGSKQPRAFLLEYAWPTDKHCGEPCPNEPMMIHELLTLGADEFEKRVSRREKNVRPPPLSDEEKATLAEADPETRKALVNQRKQLVRRRALLDRNRYFITRLHHRYAADSLTSDISVRPAKHVGGGIGLPTGPEGEASRAIEDVEESKFQVRFNAFHRNKKVEECDNPVPHRWGLPPRSYRGLRKTWTARDLAFKKRTRFELDKVVYSAVPALGIAATSTVPSAPVEQSVPEPEASCSIAAANPLNRGLGANLWALLGVPVLLWRRRYRTVGS